MWERIWDGQGECRVQCLEEVVDQFDGLWKGLAVLKEFQKLRCLIITYLWNCHTNIIRLIRVKRN